MFTSGVFPLLGKTREELLSRESRAGKRALITRRNQGNNPLNRL
jgi:hypothetical protein